MTKDTVVLPGIRVVEDGDDVRLEVDIPEMLARFGLPDSEENRDLMTELVQNACAETWPDLPQRVARKTH